MRTIKEWVVVEGKSDSANLKRYFQVNTIETSGLGLNESTKDLIIKVNNEVGIIVLTDPDTSGNIIRSAVNKLIPNCKNAYLSNKQCRNKTKVGVEFASKQALEQALNQLITYQDCEILWQMSDLYDLGCAGGKKSQTKREKLSLYFQLGDCNAKSMLRRLNALGISKEKTSEVLNNEH